MRSSLRMPFHRTDNKGRHEPAERSPASAKPADAASRLVNETSYALDS
jgi:hypothetical protein